VRIRTGLAIVKLPNPHGAPAGAPRKSTFDPCRGDRGGRLGRGAGRAAPPAAGGVFPLGTAAKTWGPRSAAGTRDPAACRRVGRAPGPASHGGARNSHHVIAC